jgi:hypothetical protein
MGISQQGMQNASFKIHPATASFRPGLAKPIREWRLRSGLRPLDAGTHGAACESHDAKGMMQNANRGEQTRSCL